MLRRLQLDQVGPRLYQLHLTRKQAKGRDFRFIGLVLIAAAVGLFIFVDFDFNIDPMLPLSFILLALLGIIIIIRSPRGHHVDTLIELDLARRVLVTAQLVTNGSGRPGREIPFEQVAEFLFAMKEAPLDPESPRSPTVDAFAVHLRTLEGEVLTIVETCFDQDTSFRTARSMASMVNVGVKQVGKGWRSD